MNVSVPSRGLCFQFSIVIEGQEDATRFPSPLGDYVFNSSETMKNKYDIIGFRPLSGIMFSILSILAVWLGMYSSFRPLSGIMFSIHDIAEI